MGLPRPIARFSRGGFETHRVSPVRFRARELQQHIRLGHKRDTQNAAQNMTAGSPTLFGMEQTALTSDDFYTPAWVFDALGIEFDLDVCAPPDGIPWIPTKRFFTMADDGLTQPWTGRVWMNPPFSSPKPWVEKFVAHGHGICLVPVSTAPWFRLLWDSPAVVGLFGDRAVFARGLDGERGVPLRCMLFAFSAECVEAINRLGVLRVAT